MTRPCSDQFGAYFKALHDHDPFPWQRKLTARILAEVDGKWPALLDIPTGLGKTSAIDIALFVLAVRPDVAPRRIVLVVDRRVVVDQAAKHAFKIRDALRTATEGPLLAVASELRQLWEGSEAESPFEVAVLRGGMPRDEGWAHRPDRPVVALSTVDQVGSRLLFRGYGVSPGMAPVHAGLLGNDTLILLDEVQLSIAFAETLSALEARWRRWREREHEPGAHSTVVDRWAFVRMSATPTGDAPAEDRVHRIDEEDREHPIVKRRLSAHKHAALAKPIDTVKGDAGRSMTATVAAFANAAAAHLEAGSRRIAVIVNRVLAAREIEKALRARLGDRADVALLTGRMRPLDRDAIFGKVEDASSIAARVTAGAKPSSEHRPVVLVATQTIEAGADYDFDALVTECASVDALRQRFGRLDRRGDGGATHATILVRKDQAASSIDDPVYGAALANTWSWLDSEAGKDRNVDFGIAHFPKLPDDPRELFSRPDHAPVLLPAHLDALAQTNPRGEPDPDVALWLHGPERGVPEVRVVWRADIEEADFENETRLAAKATASLGVAPPSSLEVISVPLPALRAWLEGDAAGDATLADVEGTAIEADERDRAPTEPGQRPVILVERGGVRIVRDAKEIAGESTIVVPASYGGIHRGTWDPSATTPVVDLGDRAQLVHRGRPVLRLVPALLVGVAETDAAPSSDADPNATDSPLTARDAPSVPRVSSRDDPDSNPLAEAVGWIEHARQSAAADWGEIAGVVAEAARQGKARLVELGKSPGDYYAVVAPRRRPPHDHHVTSDIVGDDSDEASFIGREVTLQQHLGDVKSWAGRFAKNLGLAETLASDLELAAWLHDLGKIDPRFQRMLHGGSEVRAAASAELLAKSQREPRDADARKRARAQSGYPRGYRHEMLSVALLDATPGLLERAHDRELVLHLVGSHHGWCRPFAPAVDHGPALDVHWKLDGISLRANAAHGLASAGSSVADRYFSLTERYGWWTLAWFEAILRLADHRASEEEAEAPDRSASGVRARARRKEEK